MADTITIKLLADSRSAVQGIKSTVGELKALALGYGAVAAAAKGFDLAREAARTLDASMVLKAAGVNINDLREAVGGMVSDATLAKQANLARMFGISSKAFGNFSRVAIAASKATGQSMEHMLNSIITGTARQSRLILDNLGITLSLSQAYETYASAHKKSARALSEHEKQLAVLQTVMDQGETIIKRVSDAGGTNAEIFERGAAAYENLKDMIGRSLIPVFIELIPLMTEAANALADFMGVDRKTTTDKRVDALGAVKEKIAQHRRNLADLERAQRDHESAMKEITLHGSQEQIKIGFEQQRMLKGLIADEKSLLDERLKRKKQLQGLLKGGVLSDTDGEQPLGDQKKTPEQLAAERKRRDREAMERLQRFRDMQTNVLNIAGAIGDSFGGIGSALVGVLGTAVQVHQAFAGMEEAARMTREHFDEGFVGPPAPPWLARGAGGDPMNKWGLREHRIGSLARRAAVEATGIDPTGMSWIADRQRFKRRQKEAAASAAAGLGGSHPIASVLMGAAQGGMAGGLVAILQQLPEPTQVMLDGIQKMGAALMGLAGPKFGNLFKSIGDNMWLMLTPLGGLGPLLAPIGQLIMESKAMENAMKQQDMLYAKLQKAMEPFAEAILNNSGLMDFVFGALKFFSLALVDLAMFLDDVGAVNMTEKQRQAMEDARAEIEKMAYSTVSMHREIEKARKKDNEAIARARKKALDAQEEVTESLKELNEELQNVPKGLKLMLRAYQNSAAGGVVGDILGSIQTGGGAITNLLSQNGIGTAVANKWARGGI